MNHKIMITVEEEYGTNFYLYLDGYLRGYHKIDYIGCDTLPIDPDIKKELFKQLRNNITKNKDIYGREIKPNHKKQKQLREYEYLKYTVSISDDELHKIPSMKIGEIEGLFLKKEKLNEIEKRKKEIIHKISKKQINHKIRIIKNDETLNHSFYLYLDGYINCCCEGDSYGKPTKNELDKAKKELFKQLDVNIRNGKDLYCGYSLKHRRLKKEEYEVYSIKISDDELHKTPIYNVILKKEKQLLLKQEKVK